VNSSGLMEENTKDTGKTANKAEEDSTRDHMVLLEKENGMMGRRLSGLMSEGMHRRKIDESFRLSNN